MDEHAELRETLQQWRDDNRAGGIIDREPLAALLAERDRLREALKRIAETDLSNFGYHRIATVALEGGR